MQRLHKEERGPVHHGVQGHQIPAVFYHEWPTEFRKESFPLHVPLHTLGWASKLVRPTVAAIFYTKTGKVCLVRSVKTGNGGPDRPYGLLQGGIKARETVFDAIFREGEKEVALTQGNIAEFGTAVGICLNPLPPERGERDKLLFFAAFEVFNPARLHVNGRKEIESVVWPASGREARSLMKHSRPRKQQATLAALQAVHEMGLIPWGTAP